MAKQKLDSEIIKARNRGRSWVRREYKRYEEESLIEARRALHRSNYRNTGKETANRQASITSWVTSMSSTVLASLNILPQMDVKMSGDLETTATGMTDFRRIVIRISDKAYDEHNPEQIARMIALTRGLIYHEGGHMLYTIPFGDLRTMATELTGYRLPAIPGSDSNLDGHALAHDIRRYQWVWNLLEDQRMECAVVRTSPIIERYFRVLVLDAVLKMIPEGEEYRAWAFISGRSYLPKDFLTQYRQHAVRFAQENDLVDVLSGIDACIREYKRATNASDMLQVVARVTPLILKWLDALGDAGDGSPGNGGLPKNGSVDDHRWQNSRPWGSSQPDASSSATDSDEWEKPSAQPSRPKRSSKAPKPETDNTQAQPDKGSSDKVSVDKTEDDSSSANSQEPSSADTPDTDDTGGASSESQIDDSDQHQPGTGVGHSDTPSPSHSDTQQGLEDLLEEAINDLVPESVVEDLVTTVNETVRRGVPHDPSLAEMPANLLDLAHEVRNGMLNTLEPLAVQADPAWRFRCESGVFDPVTYKYREPGDTDYWSNLDDTGATGHDLAVSVVLDVSFSMGDYTDALSVSALGIRMACDDLDIPCTVSTFADDGYLYFDSTEETKPLMVSAHGGTDPLEALEDLANQTCGKSRHLIVVFTDGEWSNQTPSFGQFRTPGGYVIGVGFGYGVADSVASKKPDAVVSIESVTQLPSEVTKALVGYLS